MYKAINQQTVDEFIEGSEAAFTAIYNRTVKLYLSYAYNILTCEYLAQDIVSEAYTKLWETRRTFENRASETMIKSWLYRYVHNDCCTALKKMRKTTPLMFTGIEPDWNICIESMIRAETINELYMYISCLPDECSKIMVLMARGKKAREVSEELQLSVSTVKSQYVRGKDFLRKWLTGEAKPTRKPHPIDIPEIVEPDPLPEKEPLWFDGSLEAKRRLVCESNDTLKELAYRLGLTVSGIDGIRAHSSKYKKQHNEQTIRAGKDLGKKDGKDQKSAAPGSVLCSGPAGKTWTDRPRG